MCKQLLKKNEANQVTKKVTIEAQKKALNSVKKLVKKHKVNFYKKTKKLIAYPVISFFITKGNHSFNDFF